MRSMTDEGGAAASTAYSGEPAGVGIRRSHRPHPPRSAGHLLPRAGEGVALILSALLATAADARPVGCPLKGTGKGTDGLNRMQVEITKDRPGSTIVCHYYGGRDIILQNENECKLDPVTRSETSRRTRIDICEAAQPADIAQCTAQCGP